MKPRLPASPPLLLALLPPVLAFLLQALCWPWLQPFVWFLFYPAVFFSSWLGGLRGGLWATLLSVILVGCYFLTPVRSFANGDYGPWLSIAVFIGMGILFSVVHERLRQATRQMVVAMDSLKEANERLESKVQERTLDLVASRESLQHGEARMAGIVGSAMDAIISVDSDQRVVLFNVAAEAMFRCPAAEALGQPLDRFIPQRFREAHRHHVKGFGQTSHTSRSMRSLGTLSGVRADGEEFPIEASISQVEVGGQKTYTVILRDITERKKDEEATALLAAIVESSTDAIVGKDLNSIVTSWNSGAERMFGYSAAEMLGRSITCIIPPDRLSEEDHILARIRSDECVEHFETWRLAKNGEQVAVSVTVSPIKDAHGRVIGASKVARNINERRRVEAALRQSDERMRLATEATGVGIWEWNVITQQMRWDAQMFRLYGVIPTYDGVVDYSTWSNAVHPEDLKQQEEVLQDTLLRLGHSCREFRIRRSSDGELRFVQSVETVRINAEGHAEWMVGTNLDITDRRQAEEEISQLNAELEQRVIDRTVALEAANTELLHSRAELKSIFESLPGLYLVLTLDLTIVSVSDAYLKATMTTREGILGRQLFDVFPDNPNEPGATGVSNLRTSLKRVLERAEPDVMAIQKYDVRRPDGVFEEHYWSPINSPVFGADHRIKYIVHRVEDVTEFVRQKAPADTSGGELSARLQQVEAAVFQSSQKLHAANEQLEAANKELESFSYSVSHDLRAPLRAMDGFSRAVLEDYGPMLPDDGQRYLQIIRNSSQKMGSLIDDLLTFSRLSRAPLKYRTIDTRALVQTALDDLAGQRDGRVIDIQVGDLPTCEGDPMLLKQVWINLLSNAIKYTQKRASAVVEIGCSIQAGQQHAYFVRDNGAGFDMRYAHKLFGVFQRLHRAEDYEGTGVGLAIVQRVIHRHGGKIWAEAVVDQGSTFHFTLKGDIES